MPRNNRPRPPRLPGDPRPDKQIEQMIRVDHSGEYGAVRIYDGQASVIREGEAARIIREMGAQELPHLDYFHNALNSRHIRPSALLPLWHTGGWAMGALTALMGRRAAMASTVAVESVINDHYTSQLQALEARQAEPDLREAIARFRDEELEHHDTALSHEAEKAVGYPLLALAIRSITHTAIRLAKRI